jgi:tRNA (pseudouridine54-N1)-methyltransferase
MASQPRVELVVLLHAIDEISAAGMIELNDISKGRIDMLARCIAAAAFVDHGVRADVRLWLVMTEHERTVEVRISDMESLRPDERTCGRALMEALQRTPAPWPVRPVGIYERIAKKAERERMNGTLAPAPRGFIVHDGDSLEARLDALLAGADAQLLLLRTGEADLADALLAVAEPTASAPPRSVIVLGDSCGLLPDEERAVLTRPGARGATIPGLSLLASHCIVLALHYIDRAHGVSHVAPMPM